MSDINFLKLLKDYDADALEQETIDMLEPFIKDPGYDRDKLQKASSTLANLGSWVLAMVNFYQVNKIVKPKKIELEKAQAKSDEVMGKLKIKQEELRRIEAKVNGLKRELQMCMDKKTELENDVEDCRNKLVRAKKLVEGLGGEKVRWK